MSKLTFWGVQGGCAGSSLNDTYGTNTPCVSIEHNDNLIIFDSGTGIRILSESLKQENYKKIVLILTHSHWDHIQGFPFFSYLFKKGNVHIFTVVKTHYKSLLSQINGINFPLNRKGITCNLTNINGTIKVLEAARFANVKKFVYAASSSCYGLAKTPTKETHKIDPQYPYALSKYLGEKVCFHWQKLYNLPVNSIRIFNSYGNRVRTTGAYGAVFGVFLKQKLEKKPYTIVGNGKQKRDFIFISDVTSAFLKAATTRIKGEVFNLGCGKPQSINNLVKILGGKKIYIPKRPGEPDVTFADIRKIKKLLKWKPKVSFEKGVKLMLGDIYSWKQAPLWTKKSIKLATKTWFKYLK